MRRLWLLMALGLALTACGASPTLVPTPLPTAIPPIVDETGTWAQGWQHRFESREFGDGVHRYRFLLHCPVISSQDVVSDWGYFEISEDAQALLQPVYLRLNGLSTDAVTPSYLSNDLFHPDQEFIAVVHYVGLPRSIAEQAAKECEMMVFWDNLGRQLLAPLESFEQ